MEQRHLVQAVLTEADPETQAGPSAKNDECQRRNRADGEWLPVGWMAQHTAAFRARKLIAQLHQHDALPGTLRAASRVVTETRCRDPRCACHIVLLR
jgi:hypothetical protein